MGHLVFYNYGACLSRNQTCVFMKGTIVPLNKTENYVFFKRHDRASRVNNCMPPREANNKRKCIFFPRKVCFPIFSKCKKNRMTTEKPKKMLSQIHNRCCLFCTKLMLPPFQNNYLVLELVWKFNNMEFFFPLKYDSNNCKLDATSEL